MRKLSVRSVGIFRLILKYTGLCIFSLVIAGAFIFSYMQRYVVYTNEGAKMVLPSSISEEGDSESAFDETLMAEIIIEEGPPLSQAP